MSLREQLLAHKPKITPITLMGDKYYIKPLTVGEMNRQIFEQRQDLIKLAEKAGVTLPGPEDKTFDDALEKLAKQYQLPRAMASRLCDEKGVLLFDADNLDDLKALSELDSKLITDFNQAMAAERPKDLVSEESFN